MVNKLASKLGVKFEVIVAAGFILTIGIFSLLAYYTYQNNTAQLEAGRLVAHTNEVLLNTERLLDNLFEAETSQRGYLIAADSSFLKPYFGAADSIHYTFNTLNQLTADNPAQQANLKKLKPLITQRLESLEENLSLRVDAGFEQSRIRLLSMRGRTLMLNIKQRIKGMQQVEMNLLADRKNISEREIAAFNLTYFISIAVIVLIFFSLFVIIYSNLKKRDKSEQALQHLKNELEITVQERTAALLKANDTLVLNSELLNDMGALGKIGGWEIDLTDMTDMTVNWTDEVYRIHELEPGKKPTVEEGINYYAPEAQPIVQEAVNQAITTGQGWNLEVPFITAKGTHLWVRAIGKAEFREGKAVRVYGTFQDITEQKAIRDQIDKLNETLEQKVIERTEQLELANKELESFTYSVSHDLRAPLRSINGYAAALTEDYAAQLDEEGKRLLDVVRNNAKRMGQLIDDLLEFSRLGRQTLSKSNLNMDEVVKEITHEQIDIKNGQKVELTIKPLGKALADFNMIRQVWINLISNSLKYSSKKEKSIIEIGCLNGNDSGKTFFIKDNGAGFDMAYTNKLFGVFQRLHKTKDFEGTGVGLALSKRIIDKHEGKIWAESAINEGATFYFTLPK